MRKYRHRRERKQRKIIIGSVFTLLLCISVGYAAFQTTLKVNVKGNVFNKGDACFKIEDNGDGTASIVSYDKTCGSEVVIPSKIKGKTITKIADGQGWKIKDQHSEDLGAFANRKITKVTFPDTLTYIGNMAFYSNQISSLILPNSVTYVGGEAFKNDQISYLKLSDNLKYIKPLAFANNLLSEITIPKTVTELGAGAFTLNKLTGDNAYIYGINSDGTINKDILNSYAGDYTEELNIPNVKIIDSYAFRDIHNNDKEVTLPSTVTTIRYGAFAWCDMKSITIPSSITSIQGETFTSSTLTINIDRKENAITGSPWGASKATVNWTGTK